MVLAQFACPHCTEQFALEDPPPGETIACPQCGQRIGIPEVIPPPADDPSAQGVPPATESRAVRGVQFDFLDEESAGQRRHAQFEQSRPRPALRPLVRAERQRRQQLRSFVVMVLCLITLAVAVVLLGRL